MITCYTHSGPATRSGDDLWCADEYYLVPGTLATQAFRILDCHVRLFRLFSCNVAMQIWKETELVRTIDLSEVFLRSFCAPTQAWVAGLRR